MTKKVLIKNKDDMIALAREIALSVSSPMVVALKGDLGAGKTFFARAFINALREKETQILSPTFNLVYSYNTKKGEVFHFDLYRLKDARELENIGFFDAMKNGICLVEWPEIAQKFLPKDVLRIGIFGDGDGREVVIE